jgi:hypothetical protein
MAYAVIRPYDPTDCEGAAARESAAVHPRPGHAVVETLVFDQIEEYRERIGIRTRLGRDNVRTIRYHREVLNAGTCSMGQNVHSALAHTRVHACKSGSTQDQHQSNSNR